MSRRAWSARVVWSLLALLACQAALEQSARADRLYVRGLSRPTDEGRFDLLVTLVNGQGDPVPNPGPLSADDMALYAGIDAPRRLEIEDASVSSLGPSGPAIRIVLLLPEAGAFAAGSGEADADEVAWLRRAVTDALGALRASGLEILVQVGFYGRDLRWSPSVRLSEMRGWDELLSAENRVAPATRTHVRHLIEVLERARDDRDELLRRDAEEGVLGDFLIWVVGPSFSRDVDAGGIDCDTLRWVMRWDGGSPTLAVVYDPPSADTMDGESRTERVWSMPSCSHPFRCCSGSS